MDEDLIIEQLQKCAHIKYSDEQKDILKHKGGLVIIACAGASKTTMLTHLLVKRIKAKEIRDPSRVLCTTYSNGGAEELKDRLDKLCRSMGVPTTVNVQTIHASYLKVLRHFGIMNDVIKDKKRRALIKQAVKDNGLNSYDDELIDKIESYISYQINYLMSDSDLVNSYVFDLKIRLDQYSAIRQRYAELKNQEKLIDYDDMQLYMYSFVVVQQRQDVIAYCRSLWEHFYEDETQDTSRIQFEILRRLAVDSSKVAFIGDPDQCIYQWRGADPSILINMCGYYDVKMFKLSTNFRCRESIVELAKVGIEYNTNRIKNEMGAFNKGGSVKIVNGKGENIFEKSKYVLKYIVDLVKNKEVDEKDIAVLTRNSAPISVLNAMLYREGIFTDTRKGMKLSQNIHFINAMDIMKLADNTKDSNLTARLLNKIVMFLNGSKASYMSKFQSGANMSLSEALGYILKKYGMCSDINFDTSRFKLPKIVDVRMEDFYKGLREETKNSLKLMYTLMSNDDIDKRVVGLLNMYLVATEFSRKDAESQEVAEGVIEYICDTVLDCGTDRARSFFNSLKQYEFGSITTFRSNIQFTTLHSSKGKEWKYVIIFGDDNVLNVSFDRISDMYEGGVSNNDIVSYIEEGRRLHYTGLTRAKEELAIFTEEDRISVYLAECLGVLNKHNANIDIINYARNGYLADYVVEDSWDRIKEKYEFEIKIDDFKYTSEDIFQSTVEEREEPEISDEGNIQLNFSF